jgi:hypothetical protein
MKYYTVPRSIEVVSIGKSANADGNLFTLKYLL